MNSAFIETVKILIFYLAAIPSQSISSFIPKDPSIWVFGAWQGKRYADNPRALFEYICDNQKNIHAFWISKDKELVKLINKEGYSAVYAYSSLGFWLSARANVVCVSHSIYEDVNPWLLSSRTNVINLWHGTPLKKIPKLRDAFSIDSFQFKCIKYLQKINTLLKEVLNLAEVKFYISSSSVSQELLANFFEVSLDKVLITGYPRNDILFKKKEYFHKKIFVYMPTYRPNISLVQLMKNFGYDQKELVRFLKREDTLLYIKAHDADVISEDIAQLVDGKYVKIVESHEDVYNLLSQSYALITDYSSVYFDYLLLNRPIIFTPFDIQEYSAMGFQFEYGDVTPGNKCYDWVAVIEAMTSVVDNPGKYKKERDTINKIFNQYTSRNSERTYKTLAKYLHI